MTTTWIIAGIITILAFVALMAKLDPTLMRRILGYDLYFDVLISVTLMIILSGTFVGMMTGLLAGLILSMMLIPAKLVMGYEKYEKVTCQHCMHSHWEWVRHHPRRLRWG